MSGVTVLGKSLGEHLTVGARALIELERDQPDHTCVLGWQDSRFILIEWPMRQQTPAPLTVGKRCRLRFLGPKHACAFESSIIDYRQMGVDSWCWVQWPNHFQLRMFRKHERFAAYIPCSLARSQGSAITGEIIDLSLGGLCINVPEPLEPGDHLAAAFTLDPMEIEGLQVEVKSCRPSCSGHYRLGCEILANQDVAISDIAYFLGQRARFPEAQVQNRIAILHGKSAEFESFERYLRNAGWQCLFFPTAFDLLSRVRLVRPSAVLAVDAPDLPVDAVFHLLDHTRGMGQIPLYMLQNGERGTLPDGVHVLTELSETVAKELVAALTDAKRGSRV